MFLLYQHQPFTIGMPSWCRHFLIVFVCFFLSPLAFCTSSLNFPKRICTFLGADHHVPTAQWFQFIQNEYICNTVWKLILQMSNVYCTLYKKHSMKKKAAALKARQPRLIWFIVHYHTISPELHLCGSREEDLVNIYWSGWMRERTTEEVILWFCQFWWFNIIDWSVDSLKWSIN